MRKLPVLLTLGAVFSMASIHILAQTGNAKFIGAKKCKMCHMSKKRGDQWNKWSEGPHSKAFTVLASEESKAIAEKLGLSKDPQQAPECLKCHVTGYGVPASAKEASFAPEEEGVGCEACHGAGSLYKSMKVMKALTAGEQDPKEVGLLDPNEALCVTCHNEESPTYKPFVFCEAAAKIAHPIPEAE